MKTKIIRQILLTALALITIPALAQKQKNIVIDPGLEANSTALKIKMGGQALNKIPKYEFGDYAVVEGKVGAVKSSGSSNLFDTQQQEKGKTQFSFVMTDRAENRATVNAHINQEHRSSKEQKLIAFFYIGENEVLLDKHNFSATIFLNNDTSNLWLLFMNYETGSQSNNTGTAFLTNGQRKILIVSASSNSNLKNARKIPALGYQFIENKQALSAIQYYGGGLLGLNKGLVWIDHQLDEQLKLVLSSAMTALLHKEYSEVSEIDDLDDYEDW